MTRFTTVSVSLPLSPNKLLTTYLSTYRIKVFQGLGASHLNIYSSMFYDSTPVYAASHSRSTQHMDLTHSRANRPVRYPPSTSSDTAVFTPVFFSAECNDRREMRFLGGASALPNQAEISKGLQSWLYPLGRTFRHYHLFPSMSHNTISTWQSVICMVFRSETNSCSRSCVGAKHRPK